MQIRYLPCHSKSLQLWAIIKHAYSYQLKQNNNTNRFIFHFFTFSQRKKVSTKNSDPLYSSCRVLRTAVATSSISTARNCSKGRGSGPTEKTSLLPSSFTPPFHTWNCPFAALLGCPGTFLRSMGLQADFPFPRGCPNTNIPASASCSFFCSAKADRWNRPHDLQASIVTELPSFGMRS